MDSPGGSPERRFWLWHLRALRFIIVALLASGCNARPAAVCTSPGSVRVYDAAIDEQWIDYVWLEIPAGAGDGTFSGRLFVASADPVGAIVPTMIDLPCETAGGRAVEYAPAVVDLDLAGGKLHTSYDWGSCARCSECYMHWTFSLDLNGQLTEGKLAADLVLNETFHSEPMQVARVVLQEVSQACSEPRMTCRGAGDCDAIRFEARQ